jgi:DNA adenine methylase
MSRGTTKKPKKKKKALLSPFRYPGGKIWLRPLIRQWLSDTVDELVECFAGGANVTLTAVSEGLAKKATMIEIDPDVASVWEAMLNGKASWLSNKIETFKPARRTVLAQLKIRPRTDHTRAWTTLLRNRVSHGGILAPGAGLLRRGEDDNGIKSRWYPQTLASRVAEINKIRSKLRFIQGDGLAWIENYKSKSDSESIAFFVDPPYSSIGDRLYTFGQVDHRRLFRATAELPGRVLMTYHDSSEIRELAKWFGFSFREVQMISRQHTTKTELLVSKDFKWLKTDEA